MKSSRKRLAGIAAIVAFAALLLFRSDTLDPGSQAVEDAIEDYNMSLKDYREKVLRKNPDEHADKNLHDQSIVAAMARFGPRFLALASQYPGTESARMALCQITYNAGFSEEDKSKAMSTLAKEYNSHPDMIEGLYVHHFRPQVDAKKYCRAVLEQQNLSRHVAGLAKYSLAVGLSNVITNEERIPDADAAEAISLLRSVRRDYADLPHPIAHDKRSLGESAKDLDFYITSLMVGSHSPEIVGKDVEGNVIRLSDHSGKVILLVFGGEWCIPCRAMYAAEKRLFEEFREQGLMIIGVNSDSKAKLRKAIEREKFPWPIIWDDGSSMGRITSGWCIHDVPSFILIDRSGIIRKKKFAGDSPDDRAESIRSEISRILPD